MWQGVYTVRFASVRGWQGEGLAYVNQGSVHGADAGHYFLGTLEERADGFLARLRVLRQPDPDAAPGRLARREWHLLLQGRCDAGMFHAVARVEGRRGLVLDVVGVHEKLREWKTVDWGAACASSSAG